MDNFNFSQNVSDITKAGDASVKTWRLEKYARWDDGMWRLFDFSRGEMLMKFDSKALLLLVVQNEVALERVSLSSGTGNRALVKGSSLMILSKAKSNFRKFRVKFAATEEASDNDNCRDCAVALRQYFIIHESTDSGASSQPESSLQQDIADIQPDLKATIPELASHILKQEGIAGAAEALPPDFPLEDAIKSCILDPSFPQLVNRVESCLTRMQQ